MLALLGSLIGLFGALAPRLLGFFESRQNHQQELELINAHADVQLRLAQVQTDGRMAEINARADSTSELLAMAASLQPTGIRWVDALNGVVRPLLTVAFFALYAAVKVGQYVLLADGSSESFAMTIVQLWSEEDWAVWAAIVTFWFGNRTFNKERGRS